MLFKVILDLLKRVGFIIPIVISVVIGYFYFSQPLKNVDSSSLLDMFSNINLTQVSSFIQSQSSGVSPTPSVASWPSQVKATFETIPATQFTLETAQTPEQKQIGLMYRETLDTFHGMLFVFQDDTNVGFWMKNVNFSLDMIFLDKDYKIVDIFTSVPPCKEKDPTQRACPTYSPNSPYRYAIELKGETVSLLKITKETRIKIN